MKLVLRIFGTEVLAVEIGDESGDDAEKPEPERTFGFHGGSGGNMERSDGYDERAAELALRAPSPERRR